MRLGSAGLVASVVFAVSVSAHARAGTPADTKSANEVASADQQTYYLWQDTSISLLPYGWGFKVDPSEQSALTLEHVHKTTLGDLFVFGDFAIFNNADGGNRWKFYGEISPRLSLGKVLKKDLSFTLFSHSLFAVKDVLIAASYERGNDPGVAEAVLVGVGFDLDARQAGLLGPVGKFNYIQLNVYARSELTESAPNGFRDAQISMVAAYPFKIGSARFLIDGYFDWVLGIGSELWSYHLNPQIKLDVGAFNGSPGKLYAGIEWDAWWNKYQINGKDQQAVSLLLKYHF